MNGQELIKLKESQVFRQATMDAIINEFEPDPNAFLLTNEFLPFKLVDQDELLDLINFGAFGRTTPVNLGAEHKRISIPGFGYKAHGSGHWRESVEFGEDVLQRAVRPDKPTERAGEWLVGQALNLLDVRLNTLIEYVTAKIIINGSFSEARYGVNYTYDPKIPAKYLKDVTSSPGWTTGGTWATAGSAKPVNDCIQVKRIAALSGLTLRTAYMSTKTLYDFANADDTKALIKSSPALVGQYSNYSGIFEALTGLKIVVDDRRYAEECRFTAPSAVSDTTLDVEDGSLFAAGDVITLRNASGDEEDVTVSSVSGNVVTISGGTTKAYVAGDRLTVYRPFLPENYVVFKADNMSRIAANNWISTPSLIKANNWKNPLPGRYTWTDFQMKVPYKLEIGAGISGGPKVSKADFVRLKVA